MQQEIVVVILLSICFLIVFALGELLYYKLKWPVEKSRKFVHISTGLLTLCFPQLLSYTLSVGFLCIAFIAILYFSKKYNFLKSINQITRKSNGSILYPIIIFVLFCLYQVLNNGQSLCSINYPRYNYYYLPVMILAICDPIAALTGQKWQSSKITFVTDNKTWLGSSCFFISSFIVSMLFVQLSAGLVSGLPLIFTSICIALGTTLAEMFSKKGFDNFAVPIVAFVILYFCEYKLF
jgi:phytol kinase